MTSIILGSGGVAGASIGGDIGGTPANPQVIGSHFGGNPNQFWVNRAGLWVPDTIQTSDLPPVTQLTNGATTLTLGVDGVPTLNGIAATVGALQTNVASQSIQGNAAGGFCRVTVSATAVAANTNIIAVGFSTALAAQSHIMVTAVASTFIQFNSTAPLATPVNGTPYAFLIQAANIAPSSFFIRCTAALTASLTFGFFYIVKR